MTDVMSPDALERALRKIGEERYHNLHPFHKMLHGGRMNFGQVQAWALNRYVYQAAIPGGFMPRNVMLVTGPSRSADIEQTLELGAHGPRRLHILLLEDDAEAKLAPESAAPHGDGAGDAP